VNRGVASATRARFNCHPEVAVLTLMCGEEAEAREVPVKRDGAPLRPVSRELVEEDVS
jgi:hypothetical protein